MAGTGVVFEGKIAYDLSSVNTEDRGYRNVDGSWHADSVSFPSAWPEIPPPPGTAKLMLPVLIFVDVDGEHAEWTALYSDQTLRNQRGQVVRDYRLTEAPLSLGYGLTSADVARMPNGEPLPPSPTLDPRYTLTPAERARVRDLILDPMTNASGHQVTVNADGSKTILQDGQVIGNFPAPNPAELRTYTRADGSQVTVDGTGRVVSSSPPGAHSVKSTADDYSEFSDGPNPTTLTSPAAPPPAGWSGTFDAAGTPAPDVTVPSADMLQGVVDATGNPLTAATPGTGGGTTTNPTSYTPVAGGAGPAHGNGTAEIPQWAIYAAIGIVALMVLRK